MALTQCPKCNGNISDTAKRCVHCGCDLTNGKDRADEKRDFDALPVAQKNELRDEFYAAHPQYGKINDDVYDLMFISKLSYVCFTVAMLVLFSGQVLHKIFGLDPQSELMAVMLVAMIALVAIGLAAIIASRIFLDKKIKASCLILKKYKLWLATEKNINMRIYFEKSEIKYKKYFDTVKVETEVW